MNLYAVAFFKSKSVQTFFMSLIHFFGNSVRNLHRLYTNGGSLLAKVAEW